MNSEKTNSAETNAPSASKKRFRNDIILALSVLGLALAVFLVFYLGGSAGERVRVEVNGELIAEYSLYENISADVNFGENSDYVNHLVIKDGKAYISEANCPDGVCKAHRAVSKRGETVVCLPHKLVVEIE